MTPLIFQQLGLGRQSTGNGNLALHFGLLTMPLSRQALLICLLLPLLGQQALLLRALSLAFGLLPLLFGLLKELPQVLFLFYLVLLAGLNKNSLLDADRLRSLRQPRRCLHQQCAAQ